MPRAVPRPALLVALLALLAFGPACGGSDPAGSGVTVRIVTPAGTPATNTPPAAADPNATPIPPPELVLSTLEVYQAGAVLVSVTGEIKSGTATFLGRKYQLTKGSQSMYAFLAVDTADPPGPQPLRIDALTPNGTALTLTETLTVLPTEWTVDSLTFTDAQTAALLDPTVANEELALLKGVYGKYTGVKYWEGAWQLPVKGFLTANYGEQRSINGSPPSGNHGGTDFGAELGTPVTATNSGQVVLARQLNVRGNMVIIDHGGGLFSGYAHMNKILVTEGQTVLPGDAVGEVGSSGLSTGPHLHWEMSSNGILLDALRFTDGTNGF